MPIFTILQVICEFKHHHINYTWTDARQSTVMRMGALGECERKRGICVALCAMPKRYTTCCSRILMYGDIMNIMNRTIADFIHRFPFQLKQQQHQNHPAPTHPTSSSGWNEMYFGFCCYAHRWIARFIVWARVVYRWACVCEASAATAVKLYFPSDFPSGRVCAPLQPPFNDDGVFQEMPFFAFVFSHDIKRYHAARLCHPHIFHLWMNQRTNVDVSWLGLCLFPNRDSFIAHMFCWTTAAAQMLTYTGIVSPTAH